MPVSRDLGGQKAILVSALRDRVELLTAVRELYVLARVGCSTLEDRGEDVTDALLALEDAYKILKKFEGV